MIVDSMNWWKQMAMQWLLEQVMDYMPELLIIKKAYFTRAMITFHPMVLNGIT